MLKIREVNIDNNLCAQFYDKSNRYFGDYNKITILVVIKSKNNDLEEYNHNLEHMAVPTKNIPEIRETMIDNYLATALPYLTRPGFLKKAKTYKDSKARPFTGGYGN